MLDTAGTALLTIRAWCEEGSPRPLRIQIRIADDVSAGFGSTMSFVDEAGAIEAVHGFLVGVRCRPTAGEPVTPVSRLGHGGSA